MQARPRPADLVDMSASRRDDGFSLIELLVVVIILGVLASIAVPTFLSQRTKAFKATLVSDLRSLVQAENARAVDGEPVYTEDLDDLRGEGFVRSDRVIHRVHLSPDGSRFSACVQHDAIEEWLVYSSVDGVTAYSPSECAAPANAS